MSVSYSHILITGASSGIGAALAKHYAAAGVTLYLTGRNQNRLDVVAKQCKNSGAVVKTYILNVAKDTSEATFRTLSTEPIDLILACAGISAGTSGKDESLEQALLIMDTNYHGTMRTILPFVEGMKNRGKGHVAMVGSMAGVRGLPSSPAYSASKAAIHAYADSLRGYLRGTGLAVSLIIPGYVKTAMTDVNEFPMPGIIGADAAAKRIAKGLRKRTKIIRFPCWIYWFLRVMTLLPLWLTDRFFASLPGKKPL